MSPMACDLRPLRRASMRVAGGRCQSMKWTTTWNLLAAGTRGGRRVRGVGVVVWRMCCPANAGNMVSCGVGGVALMNVCAVRPCGRCVLIVGWVVGFRWTSVGSRHLTEICVPVVSCPDPALFEEKGLVKNGKILGS